MPIIKRFAHCVARINPKDHAPPHFHVVMNDGREAWVKIDTVEIIHGKVAARDRRSFGLGQIQPRNARRPVRGVAAMSKDHFRLTAVEALPDDRLRLTYADGQTFAVDLRAWIETGTALRALQDPTLFARARIGFAGHSVDWIEGELDLGADNLRNLAIEQAGGIGHERIWHWLHDTGLTLEQAAKALGISRRMLIYYRDGEKPIPRSIWLACLGWDAVRPTDSSLPQRIPSARVYAALHS